MSIGSKLHDLAQSSPLARRAFVSLESVVFGSSLRRSFSEAVLGHYHASEFRRRWIWRRDGERHSEDHAETIWHLYRGDAAERVYSLAPAFNAAMNLFPGGRVLDIGCGNGSLTKRFLSPLASSILAIDVDDMALAEARKENSAPNIDYRNIDAIKGNITGGPFDLIVMDGTLAHLSDEDNRLMLDRIAGHLAADGVFCGSETLNDQDHAHLQIFSPKSLKALLKVRFSDVDVKEMTYRISKHHVRHEAIWTCRS